MILVLNSGSSSLKYRLFGPDFSELASGVVERIGEPGSPVPDHEAALRSVAADLDLGSLPLTGIGHRVVHGGTRFQAPTLVDDDVVAAIRALSPLAPLHNPANATGIELARRLRPDVPHVAVFDTAFHATLPPAAATYALDRSVTSRYGIRRYGFHGTSVSWVSRRAADLLGRPLAELAMIVLHLGNGASATAVDGGRSVETSMGMTPLEGLVMGTRSGDLDPAIHAHLVRELGWTVDEIDHALNHESGLKGVAGDNDFRELTKRRARGAAHAQLAFDIYCHRLKKYIGAYYAVLGTVDAIVFTAGVGQHSADVRAASLSGLDRLGIQLDAERNNSSDPGTVSADGSAVAVIVIPTNEEWQIAREVLSLIC
jgi:acetate kinase